MSFPAPRSPPARYTVYSSSALYSLPPPSLPFFSFSLSPPSSSPFFLLPPLLSHTSPSLSPSLMSCDASPVSQHHTVSVTTMGPHQLLFSARPFTSCVPSPSRYSSAPDDSPPLFNTVSSLFKKSLPPPLSLQLTILITPSFIPPYI